MTVLGKPLKVIQVEPLRAAPILAPVFAPEKVLVPVAPIKEGVR